MSLETGKQRDSRVVAKLPIIQEVIDRVVSLSEHLICYNTNRDPVVQLMTMTKLKNMILKHLTSYQD